MIPDRHHVFSAGLVAGAVTALVVVVLSYTIDVIPDKVGDAFGFAGARLLIIIALVGVTVFKLERRRSRFFESRSSGGS